MVTAATKLKDAFSLEENLDQTRQHIEKQRHYFTNKGLSSQGYGFSSHVWMWELNYIESWEPKNWYFWTVVLEKILESPLDCKEIQPIHPKGNQFWIFIGRTDAEAEASILWPLDVKSWLIEDTLKLGKRQEEKGTTENEMVGWHQNSKNMCLNKLREIVKYKGSLVCCSPWGHKALDTTEWLNWTEYTGSFNT